MLSNLRLAVRTLARTPFVTAIAVLSLALGIGANTAIFSLFDRMLLRPLPVPDPAALVNLVAPGPKPGSNSCNQAGDCQSVFSYPMFRDLERVQTVFTGIAAHVLTGVNLAARGQTLSADGVLVSGSYFPVLGVQPAVGRLLGPDDDRTPGAHDVVVLSHGYWTSHFGGQPGVLGEALVVNGTAMTIVGVAPQGFEGTTLGTRPNVFLPLSMRERLVPGWKGLDNRRSYWAYLFARLKPGVSRGQAQAVMEPLYRAIILDVEAPLQTGLSDQTMARFKSKPLTLEPGERGQSDVRSEARAPLLLLLGVTALVLVTACANIANLLLARAAGRTQEMAVRLSIGAGRRQILGQLLVESCTLALLGGLAGLLVSRWTLTGIAALLPPQAEAVMPTGVDVTVLAYALGLSLVTGVVFGLYPALYSSRPDLAGVLKGYAGQPAGARAASRFRTVLATSQIALSMALLVAAGLFTKSLYNVSRVDLGLATDRLVTFAVAPSLNGYAAEQSRAFFERAEDALAALPGADSVSASTVQLIAGNNWNNSVAVQGFEAGPDTNTTASFSLIGPDFFQTLGIPLMAGREFTRADGAGAPKVAIVNQAFARKFNLGDRVIGTRMSTDRDSTDLDIEIVGLVQDAKYSEVKDAVPPQFFRPYRQGENVGAVNFYVRTAGDAAALLGPAQAAVRALDPNLPVEGAKTMAQQVRENVFLDRMISTLSAGFAVLATVLAAIGLYGVLAYTVTQRTREFGLRMALGADGASVRGMVLSHVGKMTAAGGVVGLVAAVGIGRLAQALLFELQGYDPVVLGVSAVLLALVAVAAGLLPALRASRIEPMIALRQD
ncbi:MAG: ABC transporter permease [Vicinamibacterales bacterium]